MTGIDVLALVFGTVAGVALVVQDRRRGVIGAGSHMDRDIESAVKERERRRHCDVVIEQYRRLACDGSMDSETLCRMTFLHDIATNAGCAAERAAATVQLLEIAQR